MVKPTFISLFSGCGGLDVGLQAEGFQCLQAYDIDKKVVEVHKKNLGDKCTVADLQLLPVSEMLSHGHPSLLVSGSPCQGFSTVGKRQLDDPRNSLLLRAGQIALEIKPKVFIAENVAGALAGEHRKYWDALSNLLKSGGYKVETLKINARDLGLAQRRSRAILLAWQTPKDLVLKEKNPRLKNLKDVLKNIENLPDHEKNYLRKDSEAYLIAQRIKPGQKLCNVRGGINSVHTWNIPEVFGQTSDDEKRFLHLLMRLRRTQRVRSSGDADPVSPKTLAAHFGSGMASILDALLKKGFVREIDGNYDLMHTFNGKYRRLESDSVSLTVDTRFGDSRYFLHPVEDRSFTVREAARIQGFPDWFKFSGKANDDFKMIGNAVPPPMASYLGEIVKNLLR